MPDADQAYRGLPEQDGAGLKPTGDGHCVRLSNRSITVTDGPFVESKKIIGDYALMEIKYEAETMERAGIGRPDWRSAASTA